ncbi:MAG: NYN domain-containing protein [Candidatus Uhrbacteria bacterium]
MLTQRPDQRVAVFIDTQNMYHSAKNIYNRKVSFSNLVEAAVGPRILVRAIAYVAKSKDNAEQAFFDALQQQGIELKIKDVQEFSSGAKKADWDVGMAVDAIALSSKVDVIVLVTGDGDFVPLVEYLKGHGVISEVVAFKESTNSTLRTVADCFLDLSAEPDRYLIPDHRAAQKQRKPEPKKTKLMPPEGKDIPRNIRITY